MATEARIGHSTSFQRGDGQDPENFAAVSEVMEIGGPSLSKDAVDATSHSSAEGWRDFISGLKDAGEITIGSNFVPDNDDVANWLSDFNANDSRNYQIVFPDGTTWGFAAIMTGMEIDTPQDDKMTCTATYKLTGKPSFVN